MPVSDMLLEGVRLMVIGMGIVFTFLLLLVAVLRLLSQAIQRWAPEPPPAPAAATGAGPGLVQAQDGVKAELTGELLAVIAAAVSRYRRDHPPH
ncbi:MAG: sodium pump decarboxylase subunit gamma [Gammaproteobacteria bacterium]|nr:sodium pump decarboxylase subunit gamma [Gammaproteobacteria bacterium]